MEWAWRTAFRLLLWTALAIASSFPAQAAGAFPNYQGLWWNSPSESESGWGINLAHQGDVIFATWFTHDASGKGWWLVMVANKTAEGTYAGTILEATGPAFKAVPFDPDKVSRKAVGSGKLTFSDLDSGAFHYTVNGIQQAKYITRQVFGPVPTCTYGTWPDPATATNYTDLWWVAGGAESGWGISLTHQGDVVFATWFTYDNDGKPLWLAMTAPKIVPGEYGGALIQTSGPAFNASPFDPARVTRTEVGRATLTFADGNNATFTYSLNGVLQTKTITRQLFSRGAATLCGPPHRVVAPVSVVAAGDIADCRLASPAASAAARTARLVGERDDLVLMLGDGAYENGSAAEYSSCFQPTWGAFKERIRPTPGNHEYHTPGAEGYFSYFGSQAGADRRGYYSFDFGGWHFIALNSITDIAPGSEQYRWLLADLEKSRDRHCTIAFMHYPAFNSGATHGSATAMRPAFDALHAAGVEVVLSAHEHLYERFAPQRADGTADPARGVRQFTVGTGGGSLMAFASPLPNSEMRYNASWGILRLLLGQGRYNWQFVAIDGSIVDSGSGTCHP